MENWLCCGLMMQTWHFEAFVHLERNLLEGQCITWPFIALMLPVYGQSSARGSCIITGRPLSGGDGSAGCSDGFYGL